VALVTVDHGPVTTTERPSEPVAARTRSLAAGVAAPFQRLAPRRRRDRTPDPARERVGGSGIVDCAVYEHGHRRAGSVTAQEAWEAVQGRPERFLWIGLRHPRMQEIDDLAALLALPSLAVEDAQEQHQRPKVDRYGEQLFAVLKTARYVEHAELTATSEVIETGEVMVFVGPQFVVSVRNGMACSVGEVRRELQEQTERLAMGPMVVLHALADRIVDDYEGVTGQFEADLDEVESSVFASAQRQDNVTRVYQLKRELLELRRAVVPLERPLSQLASGGIDLVPEPMRAYFADVEDHLLRVRGDVYGADELLSTILNATLTQVQTQQNEDMRKITAYAAIVAVPTAITGFFGQNVHFPGFGSVATFVVSSLIIVISGLGLYRGFSRRGWL